MNEKDIKLTINKLWNEIKNIKLEQNNAIYSISIRTTQILALMKTIQREDIFRKDDIEYIFNDNKQAKLTELEGYEALRQGKKIINTKSKTKQTGLNIELDIPQMLVKPKV
jgi:hypothetical protein